MKWRMREKRVEVKWRMRVEEGVKERQKRLMKLNDFQMIFKWFPNALGDPNPICRNCRMPNTLTCLTWKYHRILDHCTKLEALEGALDQTGGAGDVSICGLWDVSSLSCERAESLQFNLTSFVFISSHVFTCHAHMFALVCHVGWVQIFTFFCSLGGWWLMRFFKLDARWTLFPREHVTNMWKSDDQCDSRWHRQRVTPADTEVTPGCSDASKNTHGSMADAEAVHLFKSR